MELINALSILNWARSVDPDVLWLYPLIWFGISMTLFVVTFALYAALMFMKSIQSEIFQKHWSVRWFCFFLLAVGLTTDTLLNWWTLTVTFYELPILITWRGWLPVAVKLEFLSTARVTRHLHHSGGLRHMQAKFFCENYLVPFDKTHCDQE